MSVATLQCSVRSIGKITQAGKQLSRFGIFPFVKVITGQTIGLHGKPDLGILVIAKSGVGFDGRLMISIRGCFFSGRIEHGLGIRILEILCKNVDGFREFSFLYKRISNLIVAFFTVLVFGNGKELRRSLYRFSIRKHLICLLVDFLIALLTSRCRILILSGLDESFCSFLKLSFFQQSLGFDVIHACYHVRGIFKVAKGRIHLGSGVIISVFRKLLGSAIKLALLSDGIIVFRSLFIISVCDSFLSLRGTHCHRAIRGILILAKLKEGLIGSVTVVFPKKVLRFCVKDRLDLFF